LARRKRTQPADLLGPLEAQIMATAWRHPGVSGVDATDLINKKREIPLSHRTILTVLSRLDAKGYLTHVVEGRTYLYTAVVPEGEFVAWHAERAVKHCSNATATTRPSPDWSVPPPPTLRCSSGSTIFSIGVAAVRRSFWLLVTVALGVEATAAFFAQRVLVQVQCYVPDGTRTRPACSPAWKRCRSSEGDHGSRRFL